MILRVAVVLLLLLAVIGVLGRWNRRRVSRGPAARPIESARRCPDCDAYVVGSRPEPCDRPDCPYRNA